MRRTFLSILLILFLEAPALGTTYYIDSNAVDDSADGTTKLTPWKRCPGMYGFAGTYTHAAGDIFIFKGGVTWTLTSGHTLLDIGYSGEEGNPDQYTVDKKWYSGGSWDYPVLDGNARGGSKYALHTSKKSHLVIDSLKIVNVGDATYGSGSGMFFIGGNHIEVKNCWFETNAVNALFWGPSTASDHAFYVHHCYFRKNGRVHILAGRNCKGDDVQFYNNDYQGPDGYAPHSYHTDGLMIGGYTYPGITNLKFYNNKFYGDWGIYASTAALYLNSNVSGATIYNNIFTHHNSSGIKFSPSFVSVRFGRNDTIKIYNNMFMSYTGGSVASAITIFGTVAMPVTGVEIKNNVFYGTANDILIKHVASPVIDRNLHWGSPTRLIYDVTGGKTCKTLAACKLLGVETSSQAITNNIGIMEWPVANAPTSGNWRLTSTSPARNNGEDLSAVFTTDMDGVTRPVGSNWDIGPFQYSAGVGVEKQLGKD